ncbi:two-component sensor histidine kinase [Sphaerisporangium rufum]|uniref:Sensor-like histidine kinase SenX3 n=1 Tax=Sphaerisporangium rufum TaxID=1381558 RepID=A0A919R3G5_9ACTN|nr:ATP-binding protein [Sphaerisporangium rufum]GII77665.1 two-component sensor histidine kinase [Sphaerisporangium rufum]
MIIQIVAVTAGLGLLAGGFGLAVLQVLRGRSIAIMMAVVAVVTVAATLAGVVVITIEMIIEEHSQNIVLTVVAIAGLVGLGIAMIVARQVVAASRRLVAAVEAVTPSRDYVRPSGRLPAELATISEALAQAYERLREGRERERALEGARRELVAWVSHDLRTPLAGMRAMVEALEDGVVSDGATVRRYHEQIRLEVERLAHMVDDLFELSRIHAGALRLSPRRIGLGDLVADALAGVEALALAKGVRLAGEAEPVLPVYADAAELGRAVRNLVVNAIRHTPADGTVLVRAVADTGAGAVRLSVADGCGGIPEEDLPRVFDVAFRGEAARTPGPDGGAGLGLAITRGIVEAHQGAVEVANEGAGCRFEITLPALS